MADLIAGIFGEPDVLVLQLSEVDLRRLIAVAGSFSIFQTFMYARAMGSCDVERRIELVYLGASSRSGLALSVRASEGPIAEQIIGAVLHVTASLDVLGTGIERAHVMQQVRRLVKGIAGLNQLDLQALPASEPSRLQAATCWVMPAGVLMIWSRAQRS